MSNQSSYFWQIEPVRDPTYGWVFLEDRGPGDKGKHRPRKRVLKSWELDESGNPIPGLDPNSDDSGGQHDATPRASSSNLLSNFQTLSIGQPETDNNNYEGSSLDQYPPAQSSPNYSHTAQIPGSYGHEGQYYSYDDPQSAPQSSSKGKGKSSSSRSSNFGSRSIKASSHHDRSHRRSSHPRASAAESGTISENPGSNEESPLSYPPGGDFAGTHPTYNAPVPSPYGLPSVPEIGMPALDAPVDEMQSELGEIGHSDDTAGPSTGTDPYSYVTGAPNFQPEEGFHANIPRGPRITAPTGDPRCRIYHARDWKIGRVFKVEWAEARGYPIGPNGSEATEHQQMGESQLSHQSRSAYWTYRRFVVIQTFPGFCHGIPIYTYSNRGCAKPGCKPDQHGIIHDERKKALPTNGEPQLGFPPVRVRVRTPNEQIHPASRVNYCKWTPIEFNVQVSLVGEIVGRDLKKVMDASQAGLAKGRTDYGGEFAGWTS